MPTVIITPIRWSRSPLQSFFLLLLGITGILIVFGISDNRIIDEMGEPWSTIWGSSLALGASISLLGAFWKNKVSGMLIERAGIFLLGCAGLYWAFMVVKITHWNSALTVVFTAMFSVACFMQVRYINKHIDLILGALAEGGQLSE